MKLKRKKILVASILGAVSLCLCVLSCQDQWENSQTATGRSTGKNMELTLTVAQQWYEANYAPVVSMRSALDIGGTGTLVKHDWSNGKESRRGRYEVVETPIKTRGNHLVMDPETAQHFDPANPDKAIRNTVRMITMKDIVTQEVRSFIMIFVGSYDYLKNTKNMGRNSYLYRESDYDGAVLFYEPNGEFING
ncbi:MAG: hypothetical protein LUD15_12530 [Bacteroides sp.]|nr:hypothetical protein [Bacteroides sp.]